VVPPDSTDAPPSLLRLAAGDTAQACAAHHGLPVKGLREDPTRFQIIHRAFSPDADEEVCEIRVQRHHFSEPSVFTASTLP